MDSALPEIVGDGIVLRPPSVDDPRDLAEARDDEYLQSAFGGPPDPDDSRAVATWMSSFEARVRLGVRYAFVIGGPVHKRAVGQIGLFLREKAPDGTSGYREAAHGRASASYWIVPTARRRGHATAALATLSTWALGLPDVHRLELFIEPWNDGSWRAAERAGFLREGLLRSWQQIGDVRRDVYVYSRLKPAAS